MYPDLLSKHFNFYSGAERGDTEELVTDVFALEGALINAAHVIRRYFPNCDLYLRMAYPHPEEEDRVFIDIHTHLEVKDALSRLDHLTLNWYLDIAPLVDWRFNINLVFSE